MSTLHVFGCSFSSHYETYLNKNLKTYLTFHNNNKPKVWPEILSENLNLSLNNMAEPSSGNDSIFHKFIDSINDIKNGDVVIIGWSNLSRFRWIESNIWNKKTPSSGIIEEVDLTKNILNHIFINKSHKLRENEVYDYEKIIFNFNKLKNVDTYFWSSDERLINNLSDDVRINKKYLIGELISSTHPSVLSLICGYDNSTIFNETNGLINDNHFSAKGHKILSDLFYRHIMKYKNNE